MIPLLVLALAAAPVARTADGRDERGAFVSLSPAGELRLQGRPPLPAGAWWALELADTLPDLPADRPHLRGVRGDWWPGDVDQIEKDRVRLRWAGAAEPLTVPLDQVRGIAWRGNERLLEPGYFAPAANRDALLLRNGDRLAGSLVRFGLDGLVWQADAETVVAADRVAAFLADPRLARKAKLPAVAYHVVLRDGTRVHLTALEADATGWRGRTEFRAAVAFPLESVARVVRLDAGGVWATDLPGRRYTHVPFLGGPGLPLAVDAGPLRIAEGTFERGLLLHSGGTLELDPPPGAKRFEALVALDAVAGRWGRAALFVHAKGQPPGDAIPLEAGRPAQRVRWQVPSPTTPFVIRVEYGRGGGVQDGVAVVEPRWFFNP